MGDLSNGELRHSLAAGPAPSIAVLIPCYNEAKTIAGVVAGFRSSLPDARIYVYDNNSSDGTAERACEAGAIVRTERRQGKGHVVRRMFADIDADIRDDWRLVLALEKGAGKGDSPHLCEAPSGPFRQMGTVPFSGSERGRILRSRKRLLLHFTPRGRGG